MSVLLLATCRNHGNDVCIVHNRHIVHELRPCGSVEAISCRHRLAVVFSSPVRQPIQAEVLRDVDLRFA